MQQVSKQGFFHRALYSIWYQGAAWGWLLRPLSGLFGLVTLLNRTLYRLGLKKVYYPPVMTLVVGNIHVGGSGKSPLILELYRYFTQKGYRVGIVSRGYGADLSHRTRVLSENTTPDQVGDEAYMIFQQTHAPMVVGARRVEAVKHLLTVAPQIQMILSDDGLQHYALGRDAEIALLPSEAHSSNSHLLPSGPLREPLSRLARVDFVLRLADKYQLNQPLSLLEGEPLLPWPGEHTVHAVAGIAHPDRFFSGLRDLGLKVTGYAFDDHHRFTPTDFSFDQGDRPLLMTEKDAAKCSDFAKAHWYKVPLILLLDSALKDTILQTLLTNSASRIGAPHD